MLPSVYPLINTPAVRAIAPDGLSNVRVYPFGEGPQAAQKPFATFQFVTGMPVNMLGQRPAVDEVRVQFDVYGQTGAQVRALSAALRDAMEMHAHCVLFIDQGRDPDTNDFRLTVSFDLWAIRP